MSSDDHDKEVISIAHFFEEYWPLLLFGFCFLMTCFFPLLFLPEEVKGLLFWGLPISLGIGLVILIAPSLLSSKDQ